MPSLPSACGRDRLAIARFAERVCRRPASTGTDSKPRPDNAEREQRKGQFSRHRLQGLCGLCGAFDAGDAGRVKRRRNRHHDGERHEVRDPHAGERIERMRASASLACAGPSCQAAGAAASSPRVLDLLRRLPEETDRTDRRPENRHDHRSKFRLDLKGR